MSNEARALLIRECRNLLLDTLRAVYPGSLTGRSLYRIILGSFPEYSETYALRDLYYLEEKGYIIRKGELGRVDPATEWKKATWSLTAKGNEKANDLINDPALEV